MKNADLESAFLSSMQQSIRRHQPKLEADFGVALGEVRARKLIVREFLDEFFSRADARVEKQGGTAAVRCLRRFTFKLEKTAIWLPAYAWVYVRFWQPKLIMKWVRRPPSIVVSFLGWNSMDFRENKSKIDLWTVHELAHGVWGVLARDEIENQRKDWRMWNEGFAHYLADVHYRSADTGGMPASESWGEARRKGRARVAEVVRRYGSQTLREIPVRWREFEERIQHATHKAPL